MVTCIASFLEPSFRGGHTEVLKTLSEAGRWDCYHNSKGESVQRCRVLTLIGVLFSLAGREVWMIIRKYCVIFLIISYKNIERPTPYPSSIEQEKKDTQVIARAQILEASFHCRPRT